MKFTTPSYVFELDRISQNLEKISRFRKEAPCKVLLALKGASSKSLLSVLLPHLDGVSASGAFEARLGKEHHTLVSVFSPAYTAENFPAILENSDIVVFNSLNQFETYSSLIHKSKKTCGIRLNPMYSELSDTFTANPCRRYSHLGIRRQELPPISTFGPGGIGGIHFHTMCGQNADTLSRTIEYLVQNFDMYLRRVSWINIGGGQLYGAEDYQIDTAVQAIRRLARLYNVPIYAEPCEGILTGSGFYVTTVTDIVHNEMDIAILDGSAVCHLTDAVYRGWKRDVLNGGEPGDFPYTVRLVGNSCYAGDIFGEYSFPQPLKRGEKVIFCDTASYTAVKACMFNGLPLPSMVLYSRAGGIKSIKKYDYHVFRQTL